MTKKQRKTNPRSLNSPQTTLQPKNSKTSKFIYKKVKFKVSNREVDGIIELLIQSKDFQNVLIFYFLLIKGLNYTQVSRILITDFKRDFNFLLIKKKVKNYYKIEENIKNKLIEFFKSQNYDNKYFFYNEIKEDKNRRRSLYIKNKFTFIIRNCFWINDERKIYWINYFSTKRHPKWKYDLSKFTNNIYFKKKS